MTLKKCLLYGLLLTSVSSCFKQESQKVEGIAYNKDEYRSRLESCKKFQIDNALLHDQAISFFECSDWNKQHSKLFSSLKDIGPIAWNFFIKPINQNFIHERVERDRTLYLFNKLEKAGGFDYFTQIVKSLNKQNFYNGLYGLTSCFLNIECRDLATPLTMDNAEWVREIGINAKDIVKISTDLLTQVSQQNEETKKVVIEIAEKFNKIENKESDFLKITDSIFNQNQKSSSIINIIKKFSKEHVLSSYLKDLDKQTFEELLDYMTKPPGISFKLDIVEGLIDSKIECDEDILISTSKRISDLIEKIKIAPFSELFDNMTQSLAEVKIAQQICPLLNGPYRNSIGNDGEILMTDMLIETLALFNNEKNLKLTRILLSSFKNESALETIRSMNNPALRTGYEILSKNRAIFAEIIPLVSKLFDGESWKFIRTLEELISLTLDRINSDESFLVFKNIWNFFNKNEKKFFVEFAFAHLQEPSKLYPVIDFYAEIGKSVVTKWESLTEYYSNEDITKVVSYLNQISKYFKGEDVLEDFRNFFSTKNVFKIIQVLSNGMLFDPISTRPLDWEMAVLDTSLFSTESNDLNLSNRMLYCLGQISRDARGLTGWEWLFNSECRNELSFVESFGQIKSVLEITKDFDLYFGYDLNPEMKLGLLDQYGIFSSNSFGHFIKFLSTNNGKIEKEKFNRLDTLVKMFLKDKELEESLLKVRTIKFKDTTLEQVAEPVLKKALRNLSFIMRELETSQIQSVLSIYEEWINSPKRKEVLGWTPEFNLNYSCSKYHHARYTGLNCPESELVAQTVSAISKDLTRNVGADHTAIQLLLSIVSNAKENLPELQKLFSNDKFHLSQIIDMMTDLDEESTNEKYDYHANIQKEKIDLDILNGKENSLSSYFDTHSENFSVLQKVEAVTRNVRFDNNYLGAHYLNSIVFSPEYDELVLKKWSLMRKCVGLKFCGKWMSKTDVKLAQNSVAFFKGLTEINSDKFTHSVGFRMFFAPFVLSSDPEAQRATMFSKKILGVKLDLPVVLPKSKLNNHNGRILTRLTMVSFFTNLARIINRNLDTHQISKKQFLENAIFVKINEHLLENANQAQLVNSIEGLLEYLKSPVGESKLIEWINLINSIDEKSYIYMESALINFSAVLLQSDSINSVLDILDVLARKLEPNDLSLLLNSSLGKYASKKFYELSSFLLYFHEKDEKSRELVQLLTAKFVKYLKADIVIDNSENRFLDSVNVLVKNFANDEKAQEIVLAMLDNIDNFQTVNRSQISLVIKDIQDWLSVKKREVDYIKLITSEKICDKTACYQNPHYDELYKLINFIILSEKLDGYARLKGLYESFTDQDIEEMLEHLHESITTENHLK